MKYFNLSIFVLSIILNINLFSQQTRIIKSDAVKQLNENSDIVNRHYYHTPLILEEEKDNPLYEIGPEINTQLSGFFDFQSNGECKHYINRFDPFTLHCVYMYRTDSAVSASRRSGYSFSSDGGSNFSFVLNVPFSSSGHPSLTTKSDGSAVICNYYSISANSYGGLHYDAAPGAGAFTTKDFQAAMLFPGCARLSNNNIFACGIAHPVDTVTAMIFNTNSNTFGPQKKFFLSEIVDAGMTVTYAAGPNGKLIIVFNPYADGGGNFGLNRMFISSSTDNGTTWNTPSVLYNPSIINGDTVVPYFGVDAIYDQAGNYYVVFNSLAPSGEYSTAKLWVIKNGGAPVLITQHSGINGIPEAANTVLHSDAGICTIDHPSLSLSENGNCLYVAYAVQYQNDTLNGFNKCHIYVSRAKTSDLAFTSPIRITDSGPNSFDERFPSLNQVSPDLGGNLGTTLYLVYQKDSQPGSCVNTDNAPTSRSTLIFRNIYNLNCDGLPGVININNEIPGTFSLYQNYPNPFNPETKIRFSVPKPAEGGSFDVKMIIYDVLGREISVPVNERLMPGTYEAVINGSNLSSGIYFYTISAGIDSKLKFIETKRMVLVK